MRRLARGIGWLLFLVLLGLLVARFLLVEVDQVGHDDMAPGLHNGDQILVYTRAEPERGDVVVCEHPTEPGRRIVGRLIGLPGDRLALVDGLVTIAGQAARPSPAEPSSVEVRDPHGAPAQRHVVRETLPSGRSYAIALGDRRLDLAEVAVRSGWYLLSDARSDGADSRRYGEVNPALCRGRAVAVLLPANDAGGTARGFLTPIE